MKIWDKKNRVMKVYIIWMRFYWRLSLSEILEKKQACVVAQGDPATTAMPSKKSPLKNRICVYDFKSSSKKK
jgi:hypothetical protein